MLAKRGLAAAVVVGVVASTTWVSAADEMARRALKSNPQREFYVYLPYRMNPSKSYWLMVGVHGLGGNGRGALGLASLADSLDCVVMGPTMLQGYQVPAGGEGKVFLEMLQQTGKEVKLRPKILLTGFSAGAQFAHRFALGWPDVVQACAAHSPGSWDSPNARAKGVPFVVTCGTGDTTRIQGAQSFAAQAQQMGYSVRTLFPAGVGHTLAPACAALTIDLFRKSMLDEDRAPGKPARLKAGQ